MIASATETTADPIPPNHAVTCATGGVSGRRAFPQRYRWTRVSAMKIEPTAPTIDAIVNRVTWSLRNISADVSSGDAGCFTVLWITKLAIGSRAASAAKTVARVRVRASQA